MHTNIIRGRGGGRGHLSSQGPARPPLCKPIPTNGSVRRATPTRSATAVASNPNKTTAAVRARTARKTRALSLNKRLMTQTTPPPSLRFSGDAPVNLQLKNKQSNLHHTGQHLMHEPATIYFLAALLEPGLVYPPVPAVGRAPWTHSTWHATTNLAWTRLRSLLLISILSFFTG